MTYRPPVAFEFSPAAAQYQRLTMPPGALDAIFQPVLRLLAQQVVPNHFPAPQKPQFNISGASLLFAGDHGVAHCHPVSAFPCEVTSQMVGNFLNRGAAMSVLSRLRGMPLHVCDVGVCTPYALPNPNSLLAPDVSFHNENKILNSQHHEYKHGARDLSVTDALEPQMYEHAFDAGRKVFEKAAAQCNPDFIILGEMGIGNTTPAAAIVAQCLGLSASECVGHGTGITQSQHAVKCSVLETALARHQKQHSKTQANDPHVVLRSLGGFELAAIAGAASAAAHAGVHILLDGVIATAAILPLVLHDKSLQKWLISAHCGSEPAHILALKKMELNPLLNLQLRLGEGSGAALAAGLFYDALTLLNNMSTFESAHLSTQNSIHIT